MNKIERKIFRGIIEKKLSEDDAFTDSDDDGHTKEHSLKTDNTFSGLNASGLKENNSENRNHKQYLDSEIALNDENIESK